MKDKCIFISAGDKERFASYAIQNMRNDYDIVINYYGSNQEKAITLKNSCDGFVSLKTTKFISLKQIYDKMIKGRYEWVAVFDDDAKFIEGSMNELVAAGEKFKLDIVSSCHSGKISHPTHRKVKGSHKIRYVNFVEMNFPVFRNKALEKYMNVYDCSLCGWGNDWWYCNVLQVNKNKNAAIADSVCIENPKDNGEMELFMDWSKRRSEWENLKFKLNLQEWEGKSLDLGF